jgi:hypothetical protein
MDQGLLSGAETAIGSMMEMVGGGPMVIGDTIRPWEQFKVVREHKAISSILLRVTMFIFDPFRT